MVVNPKKKNLNSKKTYTDLYWPHFKRIKPCEYLISQVLLEYFFSSLFYSLPYAFRHRYNSGALDRQDINTGEEEEEQQYSCGCVDDR